MLKTKIPPVNNGEKVLTNLAGSGFRKPRKGLINSNSLDDMARM